METLTLAHLRASGLHVRQVPVAYCILSRSGECRYKGELARSRALVPGLVRAQPELCGSFGRGSTCKSEPAPLAPLSTYAVEGKRMCRLWSECAGAIRYAASRRPPPASAHVKPGSPTRDGDAATPVDAQCCAMGGEALLFGMGMFAALCTLAWSLAYVIHTGHAGPAPGGWKRGDD